MTNNVNEQILQMIRKRDCSFSFLVERSHLKPSELKSVLDYLADEGLIALNTADEYFYLPDQHIFLATVITRKSSYAFVHVKNHDKDFRMTGKDVEGLIKDDQIYVSIDTKNYSARYMGFSRRKPFIVGTLVKKPRKGYYLSCLETDETSIRTVFENNPETLGAEEGDIVKCKVLNFDEKVIELEAVALVSKSDEIGFEISKIIASQNAPLVFPIEVINEAQNTPQEVREKDIIGREDFRNHLIVTIDGEDALDFDDAVEVKRIPNGYEVSVHIADVSHYVKPNTAMDDEAFDRGTSIYVADRVVPMLPKELSNGICSLNPNEDRLTLSVIMQLDKYGNVYTRKVTKGIIRSKARLTYKEVNNYIENPESSSLPNDIKEMLSLLNEVASKIRRSRNKKGALEIDSTELKFTLDEKGNPIEVNKRVQKDGEKLIEDLMIIANISVAKLLQSKLIPTLNRIHENPPKAKLESLHDSLVRLHLEKDFPAQITPIALSQWLKGIEEETLHKVASNVLLRSLAKARYSPENLGHFGLAEEDYLHFTSPIRRYPDLIVHRLVKEYLLDENTFKEFELSNYLAFAGEHLSITERRAQQIERDVDDLEARKYMSKHIGDTFTGVVTSLMSYGMYMELENGIDVLLPYDMIGKVPYFYNERTLQACCRQSHLTYTIGSQIEIKVMAISEERKDIIVATTYYADNIANQQEEVEAIIKESIKTLKKPSTRKTNFSHNDRKPKGKNDRRSSKPRFKSHSRSR